MLVNAMKRLRCKKRYFAWLILCFTLFVNTKMLILVYELVCRGKCSKHYFFPSHFVFFPPALLSVTCPFHSIEKFLDQCGISIKPGAAKQPASEQATARAKVQGKEKVQRERHKHPATPVQVPESRGPSSFCHRTAQLSQWRKNSFLAFW